MTLQTLADTSLVELAGSLISSLAPGLSNIDFLILISAAFVGSWLTAVAGVGGGVFLLTVMAGIVPPLALIPLHGVVQLGSNASRAWLSRRYLLSRSLLWFLLGGLAAASVSVWLIGQFPVSWIPLAVAIFVLWLAWGPMPSLDLARSPAGVLTGGLLTSLASMLVGASGPLVAAWFGRKTLDKWQYTALFSSAMSAQHLLKIAVFGVAGFAFWPWLVVLAVMLVAATLGTRVGLACMGHVPEPWLKRLFPWLLTALALRLLWIHLG